MRAAYFRKDMALEKVLKEINTQTADAFPDQDLQFPDRPIVLIMGCPRTGSTLLFQWLASLGIFSYPSNLIARFYANPWLGIKIQQALLEFDPINQLAFTLDHVTFDSQLGKTEGALSPSEYWYFWRQYFGQDDDVHLSDPELQKIDIVDLLKKLSAFQQLTGKPPVMKGNLMNAYIPFLHNSYQKFIFINLERDPFYSAQSLLFAREKFFGKRDQWYSAKPKAYSFLQKEAPVGQVAGQVVFIQKMIDKALNNIPEKNKINLTYEAFCQAPFKVIDLLAERFEVLGSPLELKNVARDHGFAFEGRNTNKLSRAESELLKDKLKEFQDYG